jgi:DhnA family fructose-bisphosphate aldolase class Ia
MASSGKSAATMSVYTGMRAEQAISGAMRMVVRRSRQWLMVRVAMMPGMAQAKLLSNGMKERPRALRLAHGRSSRKAARGR